MPPKYRTGQHLMYEKYVCYQTDEPEKHYAMNILYSTFSENIQYIQFVCWLYYVQHIIWRSFIIHHIQMDEST